jgi:hypothetical protein
MIFPPSLMGGFSGFIAALSHYKGDCASRAKPEMSVVNRSPNISTRRTRMRLVSKMPRK